MKAVVQSKYGHADRVLSIADIAAPTPRANEVLVRVHAAAVHPDVWHGINGLPWVYRLMGGGVLRPSNPVPGMDVAGIVEAVGGSVSRFKPGDEVFGATLVMRPANGGAYAQLAVVREDLLAIKPKALSFAAAASVPTPGIIVLCNLRPDRIKPGHRVLINGAAGNVGSLAVQMAKARGAHVTGVDATGKLEFLRTLGADRVIDYTQEDITRGDDRYDLILDVATTLVERECKRILTANGSYWMIGHDQFGKASGRILGSLPRMVAFMLRKEREQRPGEPKFKLPPAHHMLETLRQQLEAGQLMPIVGRTFKLEQTVEALRCMEHGSVLGRIVIVPND